MDRVKLYLVAGEASGDARGAELLRALHERLPNAEIHGAGGREMRARVGEHFHDWADEAVVGLWDVLKKYGYFRNIIRLTCTTKRCIGNEFGFSLATNKTATL